MKKHEFKVTPEAKLTSKVVKIINHAGQGLKVTIDKNYTRQKAIASCTRCNGEPKLEPIKLVGFVGEKCTDCMLVHNWEKVGKQLKIEE